MVIYLDFELEGIKKFQIISVSNVFCKKTQNLLSHTQTSSPSSINAFLEVVMRENTRGIKHTMRSTQCDAHNAKHFAIS